MSNKKSKAKLSQFRSNSKINLAKRSEAKNDICIKLRMDNNVHMGIFNKNLLFMIVISFVSLTAHSSEELLDKFTFTKPNECTTKRLDQGDGVMAKVPIQDQTKLLICWSYAASQLIDAWRIKNDPPVPFITSPVPLGLQYANAKKKKNLIEPDSAITLLERVNEFKSCSYNVVNDHNNNQTNAEFISSLIKAYNDSKKDPGNKTKFIEQINTCLQAAGFRNNLDIEKLATHIQHDTWMPFVDGVLQDLCKNDSRSLSNIPKPKVVATYESSNVSDGIRNMQNLIHKKLNEKNPSPIGISFCRKVFKDRDISTLDAAGRPDKAKCIGAAHTAPIVGRRLVMFKDTDGKTYPFCQFLVRDSYGTSCANYPDDPEITPSKVCENGQIWVDESALLTNTSEAFYLEDLKK